ncbi:MAG: FlgD immunoglobulin-like domain containing protein [Candidatus Eisenbacteria bacterium]
MPPSATSFRAALRPVPAGVRLATRGPFVRLVPLALFASLGLFARFVPHVLFASLVLLVGSSAMAQDFGWVDVQPIDLSTNPSFLQSSVVVTAQGEPISARLVRSHGISSIRYLGDYVLEHHDADGALLWSGSLDGRVDVRDLDVDSSGAIVVCGSFRDSLVVDDGHKLFGPTTVEHAFLLKLGADREVDWLLDLNTTEPDLYGIEAVEIDAQDRVWVAVAVDFRATEIRRLDGNGAVAESILQDGTRLISGLSVDPDGTIWATGAIGNGVHDFGGLEVTAPFTYNIYVARYGPGGTPEWVRFVEDITFQEPRIATDGSGSAYLAGTLSAAFSFGNLVAEGPDWVYDFFLTKIDAQGDFVWLREVPADGLTGDASPGTGTLIASPTTDSVYFSGFFRGSVDWGGDGDIPPFFGSQDALVLAYSAAGDFRWAMTAGSSGFDKADAVAVAPSGQVFVAGQVGDDADFGGEDFPGVFANAFLASISPGDTSSLDPAGSTLNANTLSLRSEPNPTRGDTSIRFRLPEAGHARLTIYAVDGTRVRELANAPLPAGEHAYVWDGRDSRGDDVPSGVYLYRLKIDRGEETRALHMIR